MFFGSISDCFTGWVWQHNCGLHLSLCSPKPGFPVHLFVFKMFNIFGGLFLLDFDLLLATQYLMDPSGDLVIIQILWPRHNQLEYLAVGYRNLFYFKRWWVNKEFFFFYVVSGRKPNSSQFKKKKKECVDSYNLKVKGVDIQGVWIQSSSSPSGFDSSTSYEICLLWCFL